MITSSPRRVRCSPFVCAALAAASLACGTKAPDGTPANAGPRTTASAAIATACSGVQTCTPTDAHARHQASGLDCVSCHPCGGRFGFRAGFAFPGGTTIQPGDAYTPATATTPATCTVACHAPHGSPSAPVTWSAAAPLACVRCHDVATMLTRFPTHPAVSASASRSDCEACHRMDSHTTGTLLLQGHPAAWMDRANAGFHAPAANRGLAACQTCHRPDLSGGRTGVACASCHRPGGSANDFGTCTACHGGTANATGAPPAALWGFAGDPARGGGTADPVRVGAHTAHVTAGQYGPAFGCETCHVTPASLLAPRHIDVVASGADPLASLTFAGLAVNGGPAPAWDRGAATCSSTYCHGASLAGGAIRDPVWTGAGQVFCGSCHGVPPPTPHVPVDTSRGFGSCNPCHGHTVDGAGRIIPAAEGGTHLNGLLEASGHDASWMDRASAGFHAFAANRGLDNCKACHGVQLDGGPVGVGCADCHRSGGPGNDFASCTACHGGGAGDTAGAPPAAIWGYAGNPLRGGGIADPLRVGAHRKHLAPSVTRAFDCSACHVKPVSWLSAGHVDDPTPVASVVFSGLAAQVPPGTTPIWDRAAAGCASTYCHGNYAGEYRYLVYNWDEGTYFEKVFAYVGGRATAGWLEGPMTCASCHGNPPSAGRWHAATHGYTAAHRQCQTCHPDAASTATAAPYLTNTALHLNGAVEVQPQFTSRCFGCH